MRATDNGACSYVFQTRLNTSTLRITIGDQRSWDLDKAQAEARRLQRFVDQGIDPRNEKAENAHANAASKQAGLRREITLVHAWPTYIEARRARWSQRHLADHERAVQQGGQKAKKGKRVRTSGPLAPLLPERLINITPDRVRLWLADEATRRPTQARLAFGCLRGFLNWAAQRVEYHGIINKDACDRSIARENLPRKKAKKDCLQREQLKSWFTAVCQLDNQVIAAYLQSLLLVGCRREELAGLMWINVDFRWKTITIRDKTSAERERTIPLTPYVASLLEQLPRRNEWVFSSPLAASGRLQEPRIGHQRALEAAGIDGLTLHGLRRSFKTLSEWVEVPAGIVAQIMGHAPSGTAEKHYTVRPLDLLRMWQTRIEQWILGEGGIPFVPDQADPQIAAQSRPATV